MSEFECASCGSEKDINWANEDGVFMVCKKGSGCMTDIPKEVWVLPYENKFVAFDSPSFKRERQTRYVHEDREKELLGEKRLAQINFEYYFTRYIAITGKSPAEAEKEWSKVTNNGQQFPREQELLEAVKLLRGALILADAQIYNPVYPEEEATATQAAQEALEQTKEYE